MSDVMKISDKEKEKTVKSVLKLYRVINHIVNNKLVYLEKELYTTSRKQLSDIVEGLVPFETKKDEQHFYDKVFVCYTDLQLTKLLENVRHLVQCYPKEGAVYFQILDMLYFDNLELDSDDVMRILEISRSTYYRLLKKAHLCYYYHLVAVLKGEIENFSENKLVEKFS